MVLYITEVCPTNLRPLYSSMIPMSTSLGMMLECVLALFFHWQTISAVLFGTSIINFLTLFLIPESPKWLRSKGYNEEADNVDKWYDLKHVDTAVISEPSENVINATSDCHMDVSKSYLSLYKQPIVWKPMIVTTIVIIMQQLSGFYVLLFYSEDVLRDYRISGNVSMLMSLARILGSLSFIMLHRIKNRTLMIISGGLMAVSLIVIVAYAKIFGNVENPPYQFIPITLFFIYIYFAVLGILPIPWILCGEVFPLAVKGNYDLFFFFYKYTYILYTNHNVYHDISIFIHNTCSELSLFISSWFIR